ncbi:MAG: DUF1517 domain-containing protein [Cyanobacteria bacterium J06638_20]
MRNKRFGWIRSWLKPLLIFTLVFSLVFGQAGDAMAAMRGGGRIGGGSFRAPSPTRTYTPSRPYTSPGGGVYPGGGFGFPFLIPLFGFGGGFGGLFTLLIFFSLANFLVRSLRGSGDGGEAMGYSAPSITISKLQVGLLADARSLQADLNRLAQTADTASSAGLAKVLQETTLAISRHPEYWVYGGSNSSKSRLEMAEAEFNRLALTERSKFSGETLSNVNNQIQQAPIDVSLSDDPSALTQDPGEYIVVTLVVASQGSLQLPKIDSSEDLRKALTTLGAVSSDRLLALEVLWTPQVEGETLSAEEVVAEYPELRLV